MINLKIEVNSMQLQYEKSWDKALASVDRTRIEQLFLHAKKSENFTAIREAVNHQETLLISVLIHNHSEKTLVFDQTSLAYELDGQHIATALFTLPQLKIPPHTSMPWTFLFPKGSYVRCDSYAGGTLSWTNAHQIK